jgi:hypothetical protein
MKKRKKKEKTKKEKKKKKKKKKKTRTVALRQCVADHFVLRSLHTACTFSRPRPTPGQLSNWQLR